MCRTFGVPDGSSTVDEERLAAVLAQLSAIVSESVIANTETDGSTYHTVNSVNNLVRLTLRSTLALILEDDSQVS